MNKFNEVYYKIISEQNILKENLLGKAKGLFKSKAGKNKMMKSVIVRWMNGNKFFQNGAPNKFIGKLSNGFEIKFTFSASAWNNPNATEIKYAVYLNDEDGNPLSLSDNKGVISYSYSENEIKKELTNKMKDALSKEDAKNAFTTKKAVDKAKNKEEKMAKKAEAEAAKAEAEAAQAATEEEELAP